MKKLALITGASSGVGAATARELSNRGWQVILTARNQTRLEELAASIGNSASCFAADASSPEEITALENFIRTEHRTPDVIINCAGLGKWRKIYDTSLEDAELMIRAPYLAAFNASRMFMREMLDRKHGVLIHVNSPACYMPWPSAVGYISSRFALRGLHESLCQDLAGTGVSSCHVLFSQIDTLYFQHNPGTKERMPGIAKTIRMLTAEECARVLANIAEKPRREVIYPFMLRLYCWNNKITPWMIRWLLRVTGAKD